MAERAGLSQPSSGVNDRMNQSGHSHVYNGTMRNTQEKLKDELLVLASQEGSATAIDELVQRWHPRLLRYARSQVGTPEAAADLTQETWIAIVQGLGRLSDVSAFSTWAYRIATNKCRDWQRRRHLEKGLFTEFPDAVLERVASHEASSNPRAEALEQALSSLEAEDRTLVTLYYAEELTVSEIAGIFDIPAGTVKSRLYRCRMTLRKLLEETPHE